MGIFVTFGFFLFVFFPPKTKNSKRSVLEKKMLQLKHEIEWVAFVSFTCTSVLFWGVRL